VTVGGPCQSLGQGYLEMMFQQVTPNFQEPSGYCMRTFCSHIGGGGGVIC
jgi:hypothetical protein